MGGREVEQACNVPL